jgi:rhamnosyltransferase
MKLAIVAHFATENVWDNNFLEILSVLEGVVDKIVLVTTADEMPEVDFGLKKINLIRRPNIGYDFYSYRVGMQLALKEDDLEGVFLINSSFFLLNVDLFRKLLETMCASDRSTGVRGVTESKQIGWHLQSYLLYFDIRNLNTSWLKRQFESIEPVNSKFEVVLKYEIGLGHALQEGGIPTEAMFQPTIAQAVRGALSYMCSLTKKQSYRIWMKPAFWRAWHDVNWTHFGAGELARKYGLVKAEFVRSNPHRLSQNIIWDFCDKRLRDGIEKSIDRSRHLYAPGSSGLAELQHHGDPLDIILQSIESVRNRVANARIAVVVHLFYIDLFEEILDDLKNIVEPFDLYITTPFEADIPQIIEATDRRGQWVAVQLCRNKGRDVGPFVALYRTGRLDHYDAVLKLHTKKSRYSDQGDFWRRQLYKPLCGDSMTTQKTLHLIRERGCGVLGPAHYFLTSKEFWGANRERLAKILKNCNVQQESEDPELAFFAGTMFWLAPKAMTALHAATGETVEFDLENGKQDGTLAHAWERAFCLIARDAGYMVSAATLDGKDIFNLDSSQNKVPVLAVSDHQN